MAGSAAPAPEDAPARLRRQGPGEGRAGRRSGGGAREALGRQPSCSRSASSSRCELSALAVRGRDGAMRLLRLPGQHARRRHPAPLRRAGRPAAMADLARAHEIAARIADGTRLCRRAGGRDVPSGRRRRPAADRQRDRAARAQLRPLDHRCLRGQPVREPHARRRRLAARPDRAPLRCARWST